MMSDLIEDLKRASKYYEERCGCNLYDRPIVEGEKNIFDRAIKALSPVLPDDVKLVVNGLIYDHESNIDNAITLLERQAREIKELTAKNNDLWSELNTAYQKSIRDFQLEKAQQRIEQLEAALNVAINGLGEIARGYDYSGHQIDRALYAAGLSDRVSKLWQAALAKRNDDAT